MKQKTLLLAVLAIGISTTVFADAEKNKPLVSVYKKSNAKEAYQLSTEMPTGPAEIRIVTPMYKKAAPSKNKVQKHNALQAKDAVQKVQSSKSVR